MEETKQEPLGSIRDQLKIKSAECLAGNAKVGTLMGQLLDAETKILVLSKNPRDQKTYEEDTVRIDFMNDNNRF